VDEAAAEVVRVEATAIEDITYGLGVVARLNKGAVVTLVRERVESDTWLPTSIRFSGEGRAMLDSEAARRPPDRVVRLSTRAAGARRVTAGIPSAMGGLTTAPYSSPLLVGSGAAVESTSVSSSTSTSLALVATIVDLNRAVVLEIVHRVDASAAALLDRAARLVLLLRAALLRAAQSFRRRGRAEVGAAVAPAGPGRSTEPSAAWTWPAEAAAAGPRSTKAAAGPRPTEATATAAAEPPLAAAVRRSRRRPRDAG
jgi:hypothetical protein